eukprot:589938-Amphidinium_carterae.1
MATTQRHTPHATVRVISTESADHTQSERCDHEPGHQHDPLVDNKLRNSKGHHTRAKAKDSLAQQPPKICERPLGIQQHHEADNGKWGHLLG